MYVSSFLELKQAELNVIDDYSVNPTVGAYLPRVICRYINSYNPKCTYMCGCIEMEILGVTFMENDILYKVNYLSTLGDDVVGKVKWIHSTTLSYWEVMVVLNPTTKND